MVRTPRTVSGVPSVRIQKLSSVVLSGVPRLGRSCKIVTSGASRSFLHHGIVLKYARFSLATLPLFAVHVVVAVLRSAIIVEAERQCVTYEHFHVVNYPYE